MIREAPAFSPADIAAFLFLARKDALPAFWITADPPKKDPDEKPIRRRMCCTAAPSEKTPQAKPAALSHPGKEHLI